MRKVFSNKFKKHYQKITVNFPGLKSLSLQIRPHQPIRSNIAFSRNFKNDIGLSPLTVYYSSFSYLQLILEVIRKEIFRKAGRNDIRLRFKLSFMRAPLCLGNFVSFVLCRYLVGRTNKEYFRTRYSFAKGQGIESRMGADRNPYAFHVY